MAGRRRWYVVIALAVVAVGVLGVVGTQVPLSRAKEWRCGTALRIDQRDAQWRFEAASDLRGTDDPSWSAEAAEARADELDAEGTRLHQRCERRQELALLGLGAGGALAAAAVAFSTYQLGRRRGRLEI